MLGYLLGAFINYALNYRFTFKNEKDHSEAMPKFFTVAAGGFAINALIMWVAVDLADMHYFLSQVCATGVVLLWNFTENRQWTFGQAQ
jgi:putative flippase GtrA